MGVRRTCERKKGWQPRRLIAIVRRSAHPREENMSHHKLHLSGIMHAYLSKGRIKTAILKPYNLEMAPGHYSETQGRHA